MKLDVDVIEEASNKLLNMKYKQLEEVVSWLNNGKARMRDHIFESEGGVYIFWWTGSKEMLLEEKVNKRLMFKGPNGVEVPITYTTEWILHRGISEPIALYVGKTSNLKTRMSEHLQLGTERGLSFGDQALGEKRKTTSNQVRDRIERMFLYVHDTRKLILENIGVSYVVLDGHENAVNRFYLEDRVIGELFPLFNIDIER